MIDIDRDPVAEEFVVFGSVHCVVAGGNTYTHTHTHTRTERKRGRKGERARERERDRKREREKERERYAQIPTYSNTHIHT